MKNNPLKIITIALLALSTGVIMGLITCSSQDTPTPKHATLAQVIYEPSEPYNIEVPDNYNKLLIYFHGSGETIDTIESDPQKRPIFDKLKSEGYIIAYSNAHGNAWGNTASVKDYEDLYTYVAGIYKPDTTVGLSQSMGGLAGLQSVSNKKIPLKCWAGIYPVTNLQATFSSELTEDRAVAHASGNLSLNNPLLRNNYDIPMKIWASESDTMVRTTDNTSPFVRKNNNVEWVKTVGDHGDNSNFSPDAMSSFFTSCLSS